MDVTKILAELKSEREQIEEAILTWSDWRAGAAGAGEDRLPGWRR